MITFLKYCFISFCLVLLFTGCKKYPKNNLWFKVPAFVFAKEGQPWKLTFYAVNDVDSTNADFLKVWREEGFYTPTLGKDYNEPERDYLCFDVFDGFWTITNKKKQIIFARSASFHNNSGSSPSNKSYLNQRYIFLVSGSTKESVVWDIDKLTKTEFRIITNYNGNKYEIHFA